MKLHDDVTNGPTYDVIMTSHELHYLIPDAVRGRFCTIRYS